jgi:fumarate reductase subunit D
MGIGLGVVLLLVGLIFALDVINLPASVDNVIATNTLGWILIIVGVLAIVLALVMNAQRSRSKTVVEERRNPPVVCPATSNSAYGGPSRSPHPGADGPPYAVRHD